MSTMDEARFPRFTELPAEMQIEVWDAAFESASSARFYANDLDDDFGVKHSQNMYSFDPAPQCVQQQEERFSLLATCVEARKRCLRNLVIIDRTAFPTYFNPAWHRSAVVDSETSYPSFICSDYLVRGRLKAAVNWSSDMFFFPSVWAALMNNRDVFYSHNDPLNTLQYIPTRVVYRQEMLRRVQERQRQRDFFWSNVHHVACHLYHTPDKVMRPFMMISLRYPYHMWMLSSPPNLESFVFVLNAVTADVVEVTTAANEKNDSDQDDLAADLTRATTKEAEIFPREVQTMIYVFAGHMRLYRGGALSPLSIRRGVDTWIMRATTMGTTRVKSSDRERVEQFITEEETQEQTMKGWGILEFKSRRLTDQEKWEGMLRKQRTQLLSTGKALVFRSK